MDINMFFWDVKDYVCMLLAWRDWAYTALPTLNWQLACEHVNYCDTLLDWKILAYWVKCNWKLVGWAHEDIVVGLVHLNHQLTLHRSIKPVLRKRWLWNCSWIITSTVIDPVGFSTLHSYDYSVSGLMSPALSYFPQINNLNRNPFSRRLLSDYFLWQFTKYSTWIHK